MIDSYTKKRKEWLRKIQKKTIYFDIAAVILAAITLLLFLFI